MKSSVGRKVSKLDVSFQDWIDWLFGDDCEEDMYLISL